MTLTLELENGGRRRQALLVDYAVHYIRKNGSASPKVFKWATVELAKGEQTVLEKKHALRPTTIRALYPGTHRVVVQVNGQDVAEASFRLSTPGEPGP